MRNIIFVSILSLFVFVSCQNTQSGDHTHDDGTSHADCTEDHNTIEHPEQEVFEVKTDSTHECMHDTTARENEHAHEH